ncbi:MAG: tetratricopeptide repeat protein [Flammeovirgaceae bacterium]|nr:MAG: tetratricopeptide repeat protein [Flammeovirgaceae bacterium]
MDKVSYAVVGAWLLLILPLESFCQRGRETSENLYELALADYRQGMYEKAISQVTRSIFLNAVNTEAYTLRAACKEQLKDYKGALTDLNTVLEIDPDNYEVLFKRATIRYQVNQPEFARQDFIRLLTLPTSETNTVFYRQSAHRPGTDQIVTAQSRLRSQLFSYLGLIDLQLNNCKAAIAWLDSAIAITSEDADFYLNRFLAKKQCGEENFVDDLQTALRFNPDHALAKHHWALLEINADDVTREKLFTDAIAADSLLLYPYLQRGLHRMKNKDYKGALADYERALKIKEDDPEIWLNHGLLKEKLSDMQGAYSDYSRAIELQEDYVQAWLNRGNLLAQQKKYSEAVEDYSVALLYKPDYAAAYYNRALVYHTLKNLQKACADLQQAQRFGFSVTDEMKRKLCPPD